MHHKRLEYELREQQQRCQRQPVQEHTEPLLDGLGALAARDPAGLKLRYGWQFGAAGWEAGGVTVAHSAPLCTCSQRQWAP